MFPLTLSRWLGKSSRRSRAAGRPTFRPLVESLEAREVPAFLAPISYPTGATAWDLQTADVNNDGKLDILTVNRSAGSIAVWLGLGSGSFTVGDVFDAGA